MSDPRDLVLEQALRHVLDEHFEDLGERVIQRWRAGSGTARVPRARRMRPGVRSLAAAVAAAALAALAWYARRPAAEEPFATSDVPVLASDPLAWRLDPTTRPVPGQVVFATAETRLMVRGALVRLASGSALRLEAGGETVLHLLAGELDVACASDPLVLAVRDARAVAAPGAELRAYTPGFDDPFLASPRSRPLPHSTHMNRIQPAAAAFFTLITGSALLVDSAGSRPLAPGVAVASVERHAADPEVELLLREAGTWDLVVTDYDYVDGRARESFEGTLECRVPPSGKWVLMDFEMRPRGRPPVWHHMVLSYAPEGRLWSGSIVSSLESEVSLLSGTAGEDPSVRVLDVRRFDLAEEGRRLTMRWLTDDERLTVVEDKIGGKWERAREIVQRRRP